MTYRIESEIFKPEYGKIVTAKHTNIKEHSTLDIAIEYVRAQYKNDVANGFYDTVEWRSFVFDSIMSENGHHLWHHYKIICTFYGDSQIQKSYREKACLPPGDHTQTIYINAFENYYKRTTINDFTLYTST